MCEREGGTDGRMQRYIVIGNEEIVARHFAVRDFYGVETCFCWNADQLAIFPYTENGARDARVLTTPVPVRKVQFFEDRAFLICSPQGAYKVSRCREFAVLSKNALDIGGEFYQVLTARSNGCVHLDNKQDKSSALLFPLVPGVSETAVCTYPLNPACTEPRLVSSLAAGWTTEGNLCVVAYHRKLYVLRGDSVQLIHTSDNAVVDILPVKRRDMKVAGLLLLTEQANVVILVHDGGDGRHAEVHGLTFERIHLGENARDCTALCAGFSLHAENTLWLVCCTRSKLYYLRKELFVEAVREARVEARTFTCVQYYKPNVILGLSPGRELVQLSLEELDVSMSTDNNIVLRTEMFQRTDTIMEKICSKVKELNALYESLSDEQDKLKRINMYAARQKLALRPDIEVSRLGRHRYLGLSIPNNLPKNSYVVFALASKNRSTFCMKRVTDSHALAMKMPVNENRISCASSISMDLITLMNEGHPWCLIQNFVNSPLQDVKRKKGPRRDKSVFINAKITSLLHSIANNELNMTKLREIKKIVRTELSQV